MKAMIITRFGGPEVLQLQDWKVPECGVNDVLIKVYASGVNPVDAKIRAAGSWAKVEPPIVGGHEASGVIEAVGAGVTQFGPGDEVYVKVSIFGNPHGTDAEYTVAPAALVARKPANLSHLEAAAVPLAGGTAWEALVRRLKVSPGETVLIQGGAGGVGSFAVQIAKLCGARVLATAGPGNQDTLRQLGVDVPIDYSSQNFVEVAQSETGGKGVDATFDTVSGDLLEGNLEATRSFGRVAHILTPIGSMMLAYVKNQTLHGVFVHDDGTRLEELRQVIERGQVSPLLDQVLPLENAALAHERLDTGHGRGKVVLQVAS